MRYYLNKNAQSNGDHEVHTHSCSWCPDEENRIYLGDFDNCKEAVKKAKELHPEWKINGCYYCSRECHTS